MASGFLSGRQHVGQRPGRSPGRLGASFWPLDRRYHGFRTSIHEDVGRFERCDGARDTPADLPPALRS